MSETTRIDALEAGPETDAEIARRIFNINVLGMASAFAPEGDWMVIGPESDRHEIRPVYAGSFCQCDSEEGLAECFPRNIHGHRSVCLEVVPEYSTSIAAAWKVVEKMRTDGWDWLAKNRGRKVWFRFSREGQFDAVGFGDYIEIAICRAALKSTPTGEGE